MNYFSVQSVIVRAAQPILVTIECVHTRRLPNLQVIGCPASGANDTRERVLSALHSLSVRLPARKITISISPVVGKECLRALDLPIAVAILGSMGTISADSAKNILLLGGLSLDGALKGECIPPGLGRIMDEHHRLRVILPWSHSASIPHDRGAGFSSLAEVVQYLNGKIEGHKRLEPPAAEYLEQDFLLDQVVGQEVPKRMLQIAMAGRHHALLLGPQGVGKSFLASASRDLLPPLSPEERLDLESIYQFSALPWDGRRPFRAPAGRITARGLYGRDGAGGGEWMLARHGVLFLDEFLELERKVIESLRVPLESSSAGKQHQGIVQTQFLAAANLCLCGAKGDTQLACRCKAMDLTLYRRKLSSAMEERFDLRAVLLPPSLGPMQGMPAKKMRAEVERSWQMQRERGQKMPNAWLGPAEVFARKPWAPETQRLWSSWRRAHSPRGHFSLARVAVTVSDLAGVAEVRPEDLLEARFYRRATLF